MEQVKYTYLTLLGAVYTFCPSIEKARKGGAQISMPEMVKRAAEVAYLRKSVEGSFQWLYMDQEANHVMLNECDKVIAQALADLTRYGVFMYTDHDE